ncbi:hypothetical protein BDR06DRAFT_985516 [Suillus hirtellus]|nr:hypothetical protein BDR06DRAFT_985516 [Suillus hirtellus]
MSRETLSLSAPSDEQVYMYVSALEGGHPSLAFCLRHSKSDKRVVFDLGIRRDIKEFAPAATERFLPTVKQTVAESLKAGGLGVQPSSVDVVVLSHLDLNHVGDPSLFTTAEFVLGEGSKKALADLGSCPNPTAFTSVRVPEDRLRSITTLDLNVVIGPYPCAMDIFGDGSIWILLGVDSAHHPDLITGAMQIAYRVDPNTCSVTCVHEDKEAAEENIRRMRSLLEVPRAQVLISHDIYWCQEKKNKDVFLPYIIPPLIVQ